MNKEKHLAQADTILSGMRKLTRHADYLAIIDGAMIGGYHLGNALLHAYVGTAESEHTNTPSKLACSIDALPMRIQPAFFAFAELEKLRSDHVRGAVVYNEGVDAVVWRNLDVMRQACTAPN